MTVNVTAWPDGGSAEGFRTPLARALAIAACIACHALDDHLAPAEQPPSDLPPEPGDTGSQGLDAQGVLLINDALDEAGVYNLIGNPPAFLRNFVGAVEAHPTQGPPDFATLRVIADEAMVAYSGGDGDGQADLPLLTDEVVQAVLGYVLAHFPQDQQGSPSA